MNLENYYWCFKSALSNKICDKIIKAGLSKKSELGTIFNIKETNKKNIKELKKRRNSNISWLNDSWIYDIFNPYINSANKNANWNFDWDWSENCQFTKYSKNQHYDWHCDSYTQPYALPMDPNFNNKIRKLSLTCNLSDSKDYKGGELQFQFRNSSDPTKIDTCVEVLPRGSIIVFPSHIWHRVTPVTKGTRYSLVMWSLGYSFK
jgi:PKHD-type hydroxylase